MKYEKVQKTNPFDICIDQHVFPVKCIDRFKEGKVVELNDLKRNISRRAAPKDAVFVCKRLWDQWSETGFMKTVEDSFQEVVEDAVSGERIIKSRNEVVTQFYSLWCAKSYISRFSSNEPVHLPIEGDLLSKYEEEKIESMNMAFLRTNGEMPARFINGGQAQLRYMHYCDLYRETTWGLVRAKGIEYLVPDNFSKALVVPITPKLAFIGGCRDGVAARGDILKVNEMAKASATSYLFCRKFDRTA
ncbi:hypothetical protein MNBD_GAMMA18-924 [hydrothermal vent metagenome]|uniref:Uncharacterized protein n=1 Tax=hydrothermal vent metagenome TaxID=652676 RepID=A0A3B0YZM8_9ZZZZ